MYLRAIILVIFMSLVLPGASLSVELDFRTKSPSSFNVEDDLARLLQELREQTSQVLEKKDKGEPLESLIPSLLISKDAINADLLLLEDRLRKNEERLVDNGAPSIIMARQKDMARQSLEGGKAITELLDRLFLLRKHGGSLTELEDILNNLVKTLEGSEHRKERKPLGSFLPFKKMSLQPRLPEAGPVAPVIAYLDPNSLAPQPKDTAETVDIQFTQEIRNLASSLGNDPIAIFEYVQSNISNELYYGSMKGAAETLLQKAGNDVDQASLLIALYRALDIPSRYVRGVVRFHVPRILEMTRTLNTDRASEALTRAGIPFRIIREGGQIASYELEHFWVEAYVPYANYRGTRHDGLGMVWIPIDPSFKSYNLIDGIHLPDDIHIEMEVLRDEYLLAPSDLTPFEYYKRRIADYLSYYHPDYQYHQFLSSRTISVIPLGFLPNTLPYKPTGVYWEYVEIPVNLRHRVRFIASTGTGALFDIVLPASELAGKRLTLSYIPATVEDHVAVNSFMGLDRTPAYLVRLRPVLKVGGVVKTAGVDGLAMGLLHGFRIEIVGPGMEVETLENEVMSGGYYAIGLSGQNTIYKSSAITAPEDTEYEAADILFRQAAGFLERWNKSEEEIANLLKLSLVRPILSEVMVGNIYTSTLLFGQPQTIDWKGVFVDADLRVSEPIPQGENEASRFDFMTLSGLEGSILENRVLEDNFQVESVSAAKVLQIAQSSGVLVHRIDSSNLATTLTMLSVSDVVKTEVENAVNSGHTVMIPARDITYRLWNGTGYIVQETGSGAAGYMLSGGIAGGQTADEWVSSFLDELLRSPYNDPNNDPLAAEMIIKLPVTDMQSGTAGRSLNEPLAVLVLDGRGKDGRGKPVKGADVIFTFTQGGGNFGGAMTTTTVKTDSLGIARANPVLGTSTGVFSLFMRISADDEFLTRVGVNMVSASVISSSGEKTIENPFKIIAKPDIPFKIVKAWGWGEGDPDGSTCCFAGLSAEALVARVEDLYDNPISNVPVNFTVLEPTVLSGQLSPEANVKNLAIYRTGSCQKRHPVMGECGGVGQLTVKTSVHGAFVETIMGNLQWARYQVSASIPNPVPSKVFTLYDANYRDYGSGTYVEPRLTVFSSHLAYEDVLMFRASKVDTVYSEPLVLKLSVIEDEYKLVTTPDFPNCGIDIKPVSIPCYEMKSLETVRIRNLGYYEDGTVTFPGKSPEDSFSVNTNVEAGSPDFFVSEGGGTLEPGNSPSFYYLGDGEYGVFLRTGAEPARNVVALSNIRFKILRPYYNLYDGTGGVNLPSGTTTYTYVLPVYGVRVNVDLPQNFPLGYSGFTSSDFDIMYRIEPAGYAAIAAEIDIFEAAPGDSEGSWAGYLIGHGVAGAGSARLYRGASFDYRKDYYLQTVLNRGTRSEIISEKVKIDFPPGSVTAENTIVKTIVDRVNKKIRVIDNALKFDLFYDANVTIKVDGEILNLTSGSGVDTLFQNIPLTAGPNGVRITPEMVSLPGEHSFEVFAEFKPGFTASAAGTIYHQFEMHDALPVGQMLIKGINISDGHIALARGDLSIPGLGAALQFTRVYSSSGNRETGQMGAGWTHNYQSVLFKNGDESITVVGGEGNGINFMLSGGIFKPQPGYHGSLIYNLEDNSYDYYTKARTRYHYKLQDSSKADVYILDFIEDSHRNRVTLIYETKGPFNLLEVKDASGRVLKFSYASFKGNPNGERVDFGVVPEERIIKIEALGNDGEPLVEPLEVLFDYDQHGNLISASRGEKVERYEYYIENPDDRHNIKRIVDPNNTISQHVVTEYAYHGDTDTLPGENRLPTSSTEAFFVPLKHEIAKSVIEGAGELDAAATTFTPDYSAYPATLKNTVTDPRLIKTSYTMNEKGNVTEIRVHADTDNVTKMRWAHEDGIDDVYMTKKTDPNGMVTNYSYDGNGNLTDEIIELATSNGVISSYADVRNTSGSVVRTVKTHYDYNLRFNKVTKKIDVEGNDTVYDVDPVTGNLMSVKTDPKDGSGPSITSYTYYANGLLKTVTDPNGNATRYPEYDVYGNPQKISDSFGNITTNIYDSRSRLIDSSDTVGRHSAFAFDGLDRPTSVVKYAGYQPHGMISEEQSFAYTYYPGGQKKTVTDGIGHTTTYAYDSLDRLKFQGDDILDADGNSAQLKMEYGYDVNGNRISERRDGSNIESRNYYDSLNRLVRTEVLDGSGTVKRIQDYTYDSAGNVVTDTDLHGHLTTYKYDKLYRKVETVLPVVDSVSGFNRSLRSVYDLAGNFRSTTDANGNLTTMEYNKVYKIKVRTDAEGHVTSYDYDAAGNIIKETRRSAGAVTLTVSYDPYDWLNRPTAMHNEFRDPLTSEPVRLTTSFSYNDRQHTTEIIGPRGTITQERYNGNDQLVERIMDPAGLNLVVKQRFDGNGNLVAVSDPEGNDIDVEYIYDGLNRNIKVKYPLGAEEKTYYNVNGNIEKRVDKRGIVTRYEYDLLNRKTKELLVESISNNGAVLLLSETGYDDAANTVTVYDANRNAIVNAYDELHRETTVRDAFGGLVETVWDGVNKVWLIDSRDSGRIFRTGYVYDRINRIKEVQEFDSSRSVPASRMTTEYSDDLGQRIDTDRRGITTITQLDSMGRVRKVSKRHDALAAEYGNGLVEVVLEEDLYDEDGNKVLAIDAEGNKTKFAYDRAGRLSEKVEDFGSPVEVVTAYAYDKAGNLLTVKDGRAHGGAFDQRFTYDARYRKKTVENASGDIKRYDGYDQNDNLTREIDPLGGVTVYSYDELSALLSVDETGRGGGVTSYAYDANRNEAALQDAVGNLVSYEYDALDRLTDIYQHIVPTGNSSTAMHSQFGYDGRGNQNMIIDPRGQRVNFTHDYLSRVIRKDYAHHQPASDGSEIFPSLLSMTYGYDANGNPARIEEFKKIDSSTTVAETTSMEYDHLDRIVRSTNPDGKTVGYTYYRNGSRKNIRDADGLSTEYTYDTLNRIDSVTAERLPTGYEYWPDGLQKAVIYPNGSRAETYYDSADRVVSIINYGRDTITPVSRYDYAYDANGNRLTQTEVHSAVNGGSPETTSYAYDALNRLISAAYANGASIGYTYDSAGNRLSETGTDPVTGASVSREYKYGPQNILSYVIDHADPMSSVKYQYDLNGNIESQKTGLLDPATEDIASPVQVRRFGFDIRDKLSGVDLAGGGKASFDYDFNGMRTKKITPSEETRYLYDGTSVLMEYNGATLNTALKYNYASELLSVVEAGHVRRSNYYLFDSLGSTSELLDDAGTVMSAYMYDPWGKIRLEAGSSPNPRKFTGHYYDLETGLHYFGARYYDDNIGRFISQDPYMGEMNNPPSLHRYMYAHGNPTYYTDPTGNYVESAIDLASLGVGIWSFGDNIENGNWGSAAIDAFGIAVDTLALATPLVPGGAGIVLKAIRAADRVNDSYDMVQAANRAVGLVDKANDVIGTARRIEAVADVAQKADMVINIGRVLYNAVEDQRVTGFDALNMGVLGFGIVFKGAKVPQKVNGITVESLGVLPKHLFNPEGKLDAGALSYIMQNKGLKEFYKKNFPASGVIEADRKAIMDFVAKKGYEIGIRATDPATAVGARALAHMRTPEYPRGVPAKGIYEKGKSTGMGYVPPKEGVHSGLRSDYDIAYVRDVKTGRFLSDKEVLAEVVKPLNRAFLNGGRGASFMHGAHFNMLDNMKNIESGKAPRWLKKTFMKEQAGRIGQGLPALEMNAHNLKGTLTQMYGKVGAPGSVEVFSTNQNYFMKAKEVYKFAVENRLNWPAKWGFEK